MPMVRRLVGGVERLTRAVPFGERSAIAAGSHYWDRVVEIGLQGATYEFALPSSLGEPRRVDSESTTQRARHTRGPSRRCPGACEHPLRLSPSRSRRFARGGLHGSAPPSSARARRLEPVPSARSRAPRTTAVPPPPPPSKMGDADRSGGRARRSPPSLAYDLAADRERRARLAKEELGPRTITTWSPTSSS